MEVSLVTDETQDPKRKDWEQAFKEMAESGDDALMMPDVFKNEYTDEWTWHE
jgi:hypothetical protein